MYRRAKKPWLLADVGGTNVRFALAQPGAVEPLLMDSIFAYRVADFPTLADASRAYLHVVAAKPGNAVFAVAGPVRGNEAQLTNHSWSISGPQLQKDLGLESAQLVNDFTAVGMGLPLLMPGDVKLLGDSARRAARPSGKQTLCVLGPGTGLGVSALAIRDGQAFGLETEGGHGSFAPTNEEEIGVLRELIKRFGRVSNERLLCGSGLSNLHQALCALAGAPVQPLAPEEVTNRARQSDPLCTRAAELFCDMLGSVAGDLCLIYGAWDGVYLAGGVLTPLAPWLDGQRFRRRFNDKGRFAAAMAEVPVGLITHAQPGLLGAAGIAVVAAGRSLLHDKGAK